MEVFLCVSLNRNVQLSQVFFFFFFSQTRQPPWTLAVAGTSLLLGDGLCPSPWEPSEGHWVGGLYCNAFLLHLLSLPCLSIWTLWYSTACTFLFSTDCSMTQCDACCVIEAWKWEDCACILSEKNLCCIVIEKTAAFSSMTDIMAFVRSVR